MQRRRWFIALCALAALIAACTSTSGDDDDGAAADDTETPAPGVTDDTITISMIASDLAALSEQNLAPEIGNAKEQAEAVVKDINANGGVAGRQLVLKVHVLAGLDAVTNTDAGRQACVQATEDDKPLAVIITAAVTPEIVKCVADDHQTMTITMDSWPNSFYEKADSGLFSVATQTAISREREYKAWPKILDDRNLLEGKTLGIIRMDTPEQEESVEKGLIPGLEALNYTAKVAVLPCPEGSQTCAQHESAIQTMKSNNVDVVFLVAQTLVGSATVEAAQKLQYKPQWTTVGNNVTDTVANFYQNAKDNYDGAIGIDTVFPNVSEAGVKCNQIAVDGGAEEFPKGSDGYGFTGVTCLQIQTLANAVDGIEGTISRAAVIEALEAMHELPMVSGPEGSLDKGKHDGGDYVFVSEYSASTQEWAPLDDAEPIKVD